MKKGMRELPRTMSLTMQKLNPHLCNGLAAAVAITKPKSPELSKPRGRKAMNKTESAFFEILKRNPSYCRIDREGITLRWEDGMTYTTDFVCYSKDGVIIMAEVKGAWIEGDALVKFRAARDKWPMFQFQLWQYKERQWIKIL